MANIEAEQTTSGDFNPNSRLRQAGWAIAAGITTEAVGLIMENPYLTGGGMVLGAAGIMVAYVEAGRELGLRQERPHASEPNS